MSDFVNNESANKEFSHLILLIQKFCTDRDWDQFHSPKDLAIGLSTEANELLELFRFKSNEEISGLLHENHFKNQIEEELADVLFFILRFAQMNKVDLNNALIQKMNKNALRYPIDQAKGSNRKYNELKKTDL